MAGENVIFVETEAAPDGEMATFHFRNKSPIGSTASPLNCTSYRKDAGYKSLGADAKNLVNDIFAVAGVTKVSTHYYNVSVTIGKAYKLNEMIPVIAAIVAVNFCYPEEKTGILRDITVEYIRGTRLATVECNFHETFAAHQGLELAVKRHIEFSR